MAQKANVVKRDKKITWKEVKRQKFLLIVSFFMVVYGLTFFTISPNGLRMLISSVVEFFAGAIIPLPFFPEKVQAVLEVLPFPFAP